MLTEAIVWYGERDLIFWFRRWTTKRRLVTETREFGKSHNNDYADVLDM